MPTDINKLLTSMQTGEYIPSDEEKALLEQLVDEPQKRTLGQAAIQNMTVDPFESRRVDALGLDAAVAGYGKSRYDRTEFVPDADLENRRALEQPGAWKIANGAIKGGVFAATTAVETVAGVIDGLLEGGYELAKNLVSEDPGIIGRGIVGKAVNNFTARTMQDIQRLSDDWFPNYRTTEERSPEYQENWQKHIFNANFIGDSFLKNFGFTVGAVAGGMAWAKVLNAAVRAKTAGDLMKGVTAAAEGDATAAEALNTTKNLVKAGAAQTLDEAAIQKSIVNSAKAINRMSAGKQMFGSVIAAMGEGTMEGVMAREEFMDNYLEQLNNEYLSSREEARERLTQELAGTDAVHTELRLDENGQLIPVYTLNEKGEELLKKEQDKLAEDYTKKRNFAEEQGDKVAATTFLLNLPILTSSNTIQFGRLFSGGWKSARNTLSKVSGGISKNAGKIAAEYTGIGNKALRATGSALKLGSSEATEEMLQGFVSSGASYVADARITAFNDDGYDMAVMKDLGSWLNGMLEGGGEYLSDWKNWQEGFMGLVTGLVGMPGKGYFRGERGGLPRAIADTNKDIAVSKTAAESLNNRINSKKFQDAWQGYVRHMKYEAQMGDAVQKDDQYSWRTANDKQLISDIIMFADAGRLQDLNDIVDTYAEMSPVQAESQGVLDAVSSASNESEVKNNPIEVINKVKEQANTVKNTIKMYNDMYEAMSAIAPIGVSENQIKELVATSMNIRAFESRYLNMFDDVIKGLEKYVKPLSFTDTEGNKLSQQEALSRAKDIYSSLAEVYTGTGLPVNTSILEEVGVASTFNTLDKMIDAAKDIELRKKFDDMRKVSKDRKAFLKKMLTLQNLAPEKFEQQAENPVKATEAVKHEVARMETEGLKTMQDVRNRYLEKDAKGRADFLQTIEPLDGKDQAITVFLDVKNGIDKFRAYIEKNGIDINDQTVTPQMVNTALNDLIRRVNTVEELEKLPDSAFASSNEFMLANRTIFGTPPGLSTYTSLKESLRRAMNSYLGVESETASKDSIDPNLKEIVPEAGTVSEPTRYDAAQPSSMEPGPTSTAVSEKNENSTQRQEQMQQPEESEPDLADEGTSVTVGDVTASDEISDAMDASEDIIPEDVTYEKVSVPGEKSKIPYYRTSVPEIATAEAKKAREAIRNRDMEAFKASDLSDFVLSNPLFEKTWNALNDLHAFDNVSTVLEVGDEISIEIDPDFPLSQHGHYQPLLVTYKNGQRIVLSVLSSQFSQYYGLEDLRMAIDEEYNSLPDKTQLFTFSKRSRVWAKRAGVVEYGNDEKGIINIPNYSEDAPIVYIDKNGHASVVNGKDADAVYKVSPTFADADYNKTHQRRRALYYLVTTDKETYIPIRLKKTSDAVLERDSTGKITNLQELISNGKITSNATRLRPKGVDFYMDAWIPEDSKFGLVTDAQREFVRDEVPVELEDTIIPESEVLGDDVFDGRDDTEFDDIKNYEAGTIQFRNNAPGSTVITYGQTAYDFMVEAAKKIRKKYNTVSKGFVMAEGYEGSVMGNYDIAADTITILSDEDGTFEDYEDVFFHENMHAFIAKRAISDNSPIFTEFISFAEKHVSGFDEVRNIIESNPNYTAYKNEELFVRLVSAAMTQGMIFDMQTVAPSQSMQLINDFITTLGYDAEKERTERNSISVEYKRKEDSNESEELAVRSEGEGAKEGNAGQLKFSYLRQDIRLSLSDKGYSEKEFDSMSDVEQQKVIECM